MNTRMCSHHCGNGWMWCGNRLLADTWVVFFQKLGVFGDSIRDPTNDVWLEVHTGGWSAKDFLGGWLT